MKDINVHTNIHIYMHFNTYHTIYFHGYKFMLYSLLPLSLSLALSSWYCGSMGTGQIPASSHTSPTMSINLQHFIAFF